MLLVDAAEGPMPQTRFVLDKALKLGLKPIVVINKIDKPDARPKEVHEKVFDLFCELEANDDQLDFPLLYASGRSGWAATTLEAPRTSIEPLMDAIIQYIPAPKVLEGPVQMQVATLDYNDYVGRIGIGRVYRGTLSTKDKLVLIKNNGTVENAELRQVFVYSGIERKEVTEVNCGDLCAVVGMADVGIGDTLCDAEHPEAMPPIVLDEPTLSMMFRVNDSPLFGQDGKYISSRHLRERLMKEVQRDVALRVEDLGDCFKVSGRGVLHISVLIENMRREGYEMTVSQPHVILKRINDVLNEPIEILAVDVPDEYAGKIIEMVGIRRGEMVHMEAHGNRQMLEFEIPTRGLIGFRSKALTASAGEAIVSHRFLKYAPFKGEIPQRTNGVLISMAQGRIAAYAIDGLQQRGIFFVEPNDTSYEGMIVGENSKEGDIMCNMQREKQLTNVRAASSDRALKIYPATILSLEQALEYIADDELVEVTPHHIRLRKWLLKEIDRRHEHTRKTKEKDEAASL